MPTTILLFLGAACIVAFIWAEFLGGKLVREFSGKCWPGRRSGAGGAELAVPVGELARYERDVPDLQSVVVVSSHVDEPNTELAKAVLDNFQQGVAYKFFVSSHDSKRQTLERYYQWFHCIFEVAQGAAPLDGKNSAINGKEFSDVFSISVLPLEWSSFPYIFYTYENEGSASSVVAFRGNMEGTGISPFYTQVSPADARTIAGLCAASSPDFRTALPAEDVKEAYTDESDVIASLDSYRKSK